MDQDKGNMKDPRYAPPYPQNFHSYWPGHVVRAGVIVAVFAGLIVLLAFRFRLPTDPNMPPLPDDGMYIPGPEWYYLFFLQPFWYLTGKLAGIRFIATFIIPVLTFFLVILTPLIFKKLTLKGMLWRLIAFSPFILIGAAIVFSGYPAKLAGCSSCHNPMMGVRQALPPTDVASFYRVDRQRQIDVGRYRASKVDSGGDDIRGQEESYKDANWQMRHIYEPTFTW